MIDLYKSDSGQLIGSITEAELQLLVDELEEESRDDQDYYIDTPTIEMLAANKASEHLLDVLRSALGKKDGVDIRWERRS
jgi:processive 1,2-diacylglycerol beta-glucosyltransferase